MIHHYALLLFLFLEVVSLIFVFNYNKYQRVQYLNSSSRITASVFNSFDAVVKYFELAKVNRNLAAENARLKSALQFNSEIKTDQGQIEIDSLQANSKFYYFPAKVINNSVNKKLNYITLNKGSNDGVQPDMGIVSPEGIVGVVISVSESYAMGFSVLNSRWGPSGKLKKSGFFGPIEWDGDDYQIADLREIPFHVELEVGDTIVTSGYSTVFPEGLMIGTVQSFFQPEGESFYTIRVKLATDFKSIHFVNVIENRDKKELIKLEERKENVATDN